MWPVVTACVLTMLLTCATPTSDVIAANRSSRFYPFVTVVRFSNIECASTNNLKGTCYLKEECKAEAGAAFGTCARKLGVCCVVTRNCGGTASKSNNTYYRNPGFPDTYPGGARCSISIAKVRDSICQARLTFTRFSLAQPKNGNCVTDYLLITGTDTQVQRICGANAGQHLYLKFLKDGSPIQITIVTNSSVTFARQWDIVVSQYECNDGAPNGCLQYYTGVSGAVTGFNYGGDTAAPRQLNGLVYSVCVRPETGYCGIEWSQSSIDSFSLSGNTTHATLNDALGNVTEMVKGDVLCRSDFIIIPNAEQNLFPVNADRFCGNALIPTRSMLTPTILTVINNNEEPSTDVANRGFQLNYRQIVCPDS